jgi:predicted nucleic acid-binding protein
MPFVLDASISAAWALTDEFSSLAETAENRLKTDYAVVPLIWWYEIRNLLVVSERRQRIAEIESMAFLRVLSAYPIRLEPLEADTDILRIARLHRLSFYDAAYLALALRMRLPLATLNKNLASAAASEGISLLA